MYSLKLLIHNIIHLWGDGGRISMNNGAWEWMMEDGRWGGAHKAEALPFWSPFCLWLSFSLLSALASCSPPPPPPAAAVVLAFFTPILRPDLFSTSWRSFGTLRRLGWCRTAFSSAGVEGRKEASGFVAACHSFGCFPSSSALLLRMMRVTQV